MRRGTPSRSVVDDAALAAAVAASSDDVVGIQRVLSVYSTSATVEDVVLVHRDGRTSELVLKDLTPAARLHGRLVGRPAFLVDPHREPAVYRDLLDPARHGTADCLAAVDTDECQWLLLEKVAGVELYQVGDLETWCSAAAALARLHSRLVVDLPSAVASRLIVHDAAYLTRWMGRAALFAGRRRDDVELAGMARTHEAVVDRLLRLPPVVVHGDFYASNVLVAPGGRVCPVDWELLGRAPAVTDLAALTSGSWTEEQRRAIALAYHRAMDDPRWTPGEDEFLSALDDARFQLCIQWLGWADEWTPPTEHAHDWLAEARSLVPRLAAG